MDAGDDVVVLLPVVQRRAARCIGVARRRHVPDHLHAQPYGAAEATNAATCCSFCGVRGMLRRTAHAAACAMAHALDALVRLDVCEEMRNDLHERVRLRKAETAQREITAERHS